MRRPLLYILVLYALGIIIQYTFHIESYITKIALGLSVLLLFFLRHKTKSRVVCLFFATILLASLYLQTVEQTHQWIKQFENKQVSVSGHIHDVVVKNNDYHKATVYLKSIRYQDKIIKCNEKIILNLKGESTNIHQLIGECIEVKGIMALPEPNRNPRCFNYQRYLKAKGIYMMMNAKVQDMHWEKGKAKLLVHHLGQFKYSFQSKIKNIMDEQTAGVLIGLLFGDKQFIDNEIYDDFKKNGTAHILAVSGIHMGILYSLLQCFGKNKGLLKDGCVILLMVSYAFISNFSPSVTRAVAMIIILIISKHLYRRYDLLSAVAFTALLFMIHNPNVIFDVGFQLSFVAVFSVAIIYPYIKTKIKYQNVLIDMLVVLLAIQLGTVPLITYHFNYFSFSALFINIPVILAASIALPIAFIMLPLSIIEGQVFLWITLLVEMLLEALIYINQMSIYLFKNVSVNVISPPVIAIILYYASILFLTYEAVWETLIPYKRKIMLIGLIGIIISFQVAKMGNPYEIVFVDVGQGDCVFIKTPKGKNILVDGGGSINKKEWDVGEKILVPYLLKNGVNHIDMAFVTHMHEDHYRGVVSLMNILKVEKLALHINTTNNPVEEEIKKIAHKRKTDIAYLEKDDKILIEDNLYITVLNPKKQYEKDYNEQEENNQSLVLLLDYSGTKILLTGDIEDEREKILVNGNIKADILKVPHHGSDTSSTTHFLNKVDPSIAIIQVGKHNTFGHPSKEVLKRYHEKDIRVFRNDKDGAILINIEENGLHVKTMLDGDDNEL